LQKDPKGLSCWQKNKKDHRKLALKTYVYNKDNRDALDNEVRLCLSLIHPNIVYHSECFKVSTESYFEGETEETLYVVMELCDSNLEKYLQEYKRVPDDLLLSWIQQILQALSYLHDTRHVLHRDLKCENILIQKFDTIERELPANRWKLKLCDYGKCCPFADSDGHVWWDKPVGTFGLMAPEMVSGEQQMYDDRVDIWSLGVIIFQCITGIPTNKLPNIIEGLKENENFIIEHPLILAGKLQKDRTVLNILSKMLQINPFLRPSAQALLKAFFSNYSS